MFATRLCVVCVLSTLVSIASAQTLDHRLVGSFPIEGGPITIATTGAPLVTSGLNFTTNTGSITLGDSPAPFEETRQTLSGSRSYTGFGFKRVTLSGSVTLDAVATRDAQIHASFSQPLSGSSTATQGFSFPFVGGDDARFAIQGSYDYDGGPVTIEPIAMAIPVNVRQLELEATANVIATGVITSGGSPSPFSSLDVNTAQKWSASSQVDVLIDGPVTLDVDFRPNGPTIPSQVKGKVYDATESREFEITRRDPATTDRIRGSYSWQGPIVVESTSDPVTLRGLDFFEATRSTWRGHGIVGGSDPGPFDQVTANRKDRWSVRSTTDVVLDGQLRLDATVGESTIVEGHLWDGNTSSSFPMTRRRELDIRASYPHDGGNVSLWRATGFNTTSINSLDIRLNEGQLQSGTTAKPFDSISNSTRDQWTAVSDSVIDEIPSLTGTRLDVIASAGSKGSVTISDGLDTASVELTAAAPLRNIDLIGGYSFTDGGPVSLASNKPVSLRNLKINALPTRGKLIAGESAAPFETLGANTETEWSVASDTDVTIDGIVQLDLEVEPQAFLTGQAFDSKTTTRLVFNGFDPRTKADWNWIAAAYPEEGGNMLLLSPHDPYYARGVEFVAPPGVLTAGDDASPFPFFIPNSARPGNVTLGTLGTPVTIDGVVEVNIEVAPNTQFGTINATSAQQRHDIALVPTAFPVFMMPSLEKFAAPTMTCVIPNGELVGDLDFNDKVEFRDFLILAGNFGLDVDTYDEGDLNCNGTVDFEDFLRLGNRFGQTRTGAAQPVPEPDAAVLLLIGLVAARLASGFGSVRRRKS